jgi:lipid II:glycine glycyltransferase (peptidoglycan interpeptide bridge formation enzyme)
VRQDDEDGNVLSIRGALIHQNYAWDFIAVTTPQGRKNYSSHRTLIALASAAAERGCTLLELGGIDPVKNKGVFDFKQGTGAQEITYLGEWEQANPSWARRFISFLLNRVAK